MASDATDTSNAFNTDEYLYTPGRVMADYPTAIERPDNVKALLKTQVRRIREQQDILYADGRSALLIVFQAMDCAGKDSTIKAVMTGVNPQGIHVANFGVPTDNEIAHGYLWRHWRELPRRGQIGIFNRSHYEEVVVMRVHPEYFGGRHLIDPQLDDDFWAERFADITAFETHLRRNQKHVVKFFLNMSKETQRQRLLSRIARPLKHWKFNPRDLDERALWDEYQAAYQAAISNTHTDRSPWYIMPADNKPTMRAIVAQVIADKLASMPTEYPRADPETLASMDECKTRLEAEAP